MHEIPIDTLDDFDQISESFQCLSQISISIMLFVPFYFQNHHNRYIFYVKYFVFLN